MNRYPLSPRIVALKEILGQLRPEPARPTAPPTALRAAEQGTVCTATRLGDLPSTPVAREWGGRLSRVVGVRLLANVTFTPPLEDDIYIKGAVRGWLDEETKGRDDELAGFYGR